MRRLLVFTVFVAVFSLAASVKEWKNFENGKVYSHKTPNEKKPTKPHRAPVVEERLLHSHHHDKNAHRDPKPSQSPDQHRAGVKNAERHHKKQVEEEMHLRPLNERHHKFPNPALLNKLEDSPTPQISRHKLLRQQQEANKH